MLCISLGSLLPSGKLAAQVTKKTTVFQGHPKMLIKSVVYNFGSVPLGSQVIATYELKNAGDVPILVDKVVPPAGVTVITYPVRPMFPGEGAVIKVQVDAGKPGLVNKTILVHSSDKKVPHKLSVKGTVKPRGK